MATHAHIVKDSRHNTTVSYCGLTFSDGTIVEINLGAVRCILCFSCYCLSGFDDICNTHAMIKCVIPPVKTVVF